MYHGMGISGSLEPQRRLEGGTEQLFYCVGVSRSLEPQNRAAVRGNFWVSGASRKTRGRNMAVFLGLWSNKEGRRMEQNSCIMAGAFLGPWSNNED